MADGLGQWASYADALVDVGLEDTIIEIDRPDTPDIPEDPRIGPIGTRGGN